MYYLIIMKNQYHPANNSSSKKKKILWFSKAHLPRSNQGFASPQIQGRGNWVNKEPQLPISPPCGYHLPTNRLEQPREKVPWSATTWIIHQISNADISENTLKFQCLKWGIPSTHVISCLVIWKMMIDPWIWELFHGFSPSDSSPRSAFGNRQSGPTCSTLRPFCKCIIFRRTRTCPLYGVTTSMRRSQIWKSRVGPGESKQFSTESPKLH